MFAQAPPPPQYSFAVAPNLYTALHRQLSSTTAYTGSGYWFLDTGASSHMTDNTGISHSQPVPPSSAHVIVGNGDSLPVTHTGTLSIPTSATRLRLHNVLICHSLVKNLVSVRALTRDNPVTVEFDALGFSVKDLRTGTVLLRCDLLVIYIHYAPLPTFTITGSPSPLHQCCGMLALATLVIDLSPYCLIGFLLLVHV
jgi:hypothetical protein